MVSFFWGNLEDIIGCHRNDTGTACSSCETLFSWAGYMKRFIAFISLAILVLSGCGLSIPPAIPRVPLSTAQQVSHERYSTVALVRYDTDNDDDEVSDIKPYCTAVWVDDTHILTAFHCVKGMQEEMRSKQDEKEKATTESCDGLAQLLDLCDDEPVAHQTIYLKGLPIHYVQWKEVQDMGKEPTAWHLSQVVGWDEIKDLALIEAMGNAIPSHQVTKLAIETPAIGETVHIVGHPKGFYWTFLEGTVAGYRSEIPHMDKNSGPFMQVQSPIYFGNSGGGAFNSYGELVGIADFLTQLPAEGFFVHLDSIRGFLQEQNLLDKLADKKVDKMVVGVSPHEEASPDPHKDDAVKGDPLQGLLTPPVLPPGFSGHIPRPSFHLPPMLPGLVPPGPPSQK